MGTKIPLYSISNAACAFNERVGKLPQKYLEVITSITWHLYQSVKALHYLWKMSATGCLDWSLMDDLRRSRQLCCHQPDFLLASQSSLLQQQQPSRCLHYKTITPQFQSVCRFLQSTKTQTSFNKGSTYTNNVYSRGYQLQTEVLTVLKIRSVVWQVSR